MSSPAAKSYPPPVLLKTEALAQLLPMYLVLSTTGLVEQAGPTLARLFAPKRLKGRSLFRLFELRGPSPIRDIEDLRLHLGRKLQLQLRPGQAPDLSLRMRGIALPLESGGFLLNLSFGIDLVTAVRQLQLSDRDFAPTELTMELLYLTEANAAVLSGMRALGHRLEAARLQAEAEAMTDPLTGLRNRRACDSFLARICREGRPFAILHVDLDYFKQVNDTYGHAAGDKVLIEVARILSHGTAATDCIARVGGDEFLMILPGTAGPQRLYEIGARIISEVSRPITLGEDTARVAASIGVVRLLEGEATDPALVLSQADHALYAAKEAGRGQMVYYTAPTTQPP